VYKLAAILVAMGLVTVVPVASAAVPVVKPTVIAEIPHDPKAYTEGLEADGDALYEATGENGKSDLRQVDPATGRVLRRTPLPNNYFAEGFVVLGDRILQLTYDGNVILEWDKATLQVRREIPFPNAWGICRDGDRLVVSDGTDQLTFYDMNLQPIGQVSVTVNGEPAYGLDELECVNGQVWAALWPSPGIGRIDPATGVVDLVADTTGLWHWGERSNRQVFSSLAWLGGDQFLLVGKEWPAMVRVRIDGA
jgi:glutamine cyclotransferase